MRVEIEKSLCPRLRRLLRLVGLVRVAHIFRVLTSQDWLVTRIGVISDEFWAVVEPLMLSDVGKRGNRFGDHRLMLEG